MKSRAALYAYATLVAAWLIAPTLIVVPLSFTDKASLRFPPTGWSTRWYVNFFEDPNWTAAMTASLKVASLVALVTTVIATMAAVALTRSAFRGRSLVYGSLLAPMIVPAVIIGIGTYAIFLKFNLMGTLPGFVAAHTVLALPFALIPINASLTGFDVRLEDAAMICGANRLTAFPGWPRAPSSPSSPASTRWSSRCSSRAPTCRRCPCRCTPASPATPIPRSPPRPP
jgi:putative spermidine/putrescine transport system permease protein